MTDAKKFTPIPDARDCLGHHIETSGEFPKTKFTVVFDYPECTRRFDGREWTVEAKPEQN